MFTRLMSAYLGTAAGKSKIKAIIPCMVFAAAFCFAEDEGLRIIPLLNYDFVSLENQRYHAPGGGVLLLSGNQEPSLSEKHNTLTAGLWYKPFILKDSLPGYSEVYHDIDFVIERKTGPHLIQGVFTTYSDAPVYGGFHTTTTRIGYGYELIRKENWNLTLGLMLVVGDLGINLPNGALWPLLPLPLARLEFNSSIINVSYDDPELQFTLFPENRVRMTGAVRLDTYNFYDIHDLKFNSILWYRFFDKDSKAGDFLGLGLGVQNTGQNNGTDFVLGEKDKTYDMNYYSVFGIVDAGFIKLSGGYIFYGREVYDADYTRPTGSGFFVKLEMLYQFKVRD
jgi:hypothetical protein